MSNQHPNRESDSRLEEELQAARSAWSQLEHEEPPDLLDQAVLNSARRAVARTAKRPAMRWMGGLATAAVVVMAVAIAVKQDPDGPAPPVPQTDGFELKLQQSMIDKETGGAPQPRTIVSEADEALVEPEAWVEQLLQLKRSGRLQQLEEELEAFRRAYPDFELPPELLE
jgi:hypothetical protein